MVNKTEAGSVVFFIAIERQISCAAEGGKLYLLPIDLAELIGHFIFDEDSGACAPSFSHVRFDAGPAAMRLQATRPIRPVEAGNSPKAKGGNT
jgi:hypothetical protein